MVVGNLPYYITSDILLKLFRTSLAAPGLLASAVLMMQREVAERVAATPGRRDFGLLSATVPRCTPPPISSSPWAPTPLLPPTPKSIPPCIRLRFA